MVSGRERWIFKVVWMLACIQTKSEILKSVLELRMTGIDYDNAAESCEPGHLVDLREPRGISIVKLLEPYGHSGALTPSDRIWTGIRRLEGIIFQWYDNETATELTIGSTDYSSALSAPLQEDCVFLYYDNGRKTFRLYIEFGNMNLFPLCQTELGVSCDYVDVGNMFVVPSDGYTYSERSGVPTRSECEDMCTNLGSTTPDECWMITYNAGSQSCRLIIGEAMLTWAVTCDWFAYDSAWETSRRNCFELTVFDNGDHEIILDPCFLPSPPPVTEVSSVMEVFSTHIESELETVLETLTPQLIVPSTSSDIEQYVTSSAADIPTVPSTSPFPVTSCFGFCSSVISSGYNYPVTSYDLSVTTPSTADAPVTSSVEHMVYPSDDNHLSLTSSDLVFPTPSPTDLPVTSSGYETANLSADDHLLVTLPDLALPTPSFVDVSVTSSVYQAVTTITDVNLQVTSTDFAVVLPSPFDFTATSSFLEEITPFADNYLSVTSPVLAVPTLSHFESPATSSYEAITISADIYFPVTSSGLTPPKVTSTEVWLGNLTGISASLTDVHSSIPVQTTTSDMLPMSSDHSPIQPSRSTSKPCNRTCFCQKKGSLNKNGNLMSEILERLSIDNKNTSAYRRHRTSASDQRPLAVSMGWGGICLLSVLGAGILLSDAPILVHDTFNAFYNIRSIFVSRLKSKKYSTV